VRESMARFRESGSKYLLATSCYDADNKSRPRSFGRTAIQSTLDLVEMLGEPVDKIEEPGLQRFMGLWEL